MSMKLHSMPYGGFSIAVTEHYDDHRSEVKYFLGGTCGSVLICEIIQIRQQMPTLYCFHGGVKIAQKRLSFRIGTVLLKDGFHREILDWAFSFAPKKADKVTMCRSIHEDFKISQEMV